MKFDWLRLDMQLLSLQQRARRHAVVNSLAKNASLLSKKSLCDMERYGSTEFANRVWPHFWCPFGCPIWLSGSVQESLPSLGPSEPNSPERHAHGCLGCLGCLGQRRSHEMRRSRSEKIGEVKRKQDEEEEGSLLMKILMKY